MIPGNIRQIIYYYFLILIIISCTYNNEEELYGEILGNSCNIDIDNATYALDVLPVIQNNCYGCHKQTSSFGGVNLEGYEQVKTYITNGRLIGSINHLPGFSPMPKGGTKLSACDIEKIQMWIDAGSPNN